jgi:hypothetical protein
MITAGPLSFASTAGSVSLDTPIDSGIGAVTVGAAGSVRINQPVVNLRNGSSFTASAGGDILINAQIDGRGGNTGGGVDLVAGGTVRIDDFVVTSLGAIRARAIGGTVLTAPDKGLFANGGAIELASGTDLTTGILSTTGPVNLASTSGSVTIGQGIDGTVGRVSIAAAADANLDTEVLNLRSGAPLEVAAGRDINVRAQVDGRGGAAGGAASFSAGRNANIARSIATDEGAIRVSAGSGTVVQAAGAQLRSGAASIAVAAGGDLTTASYVTSGELDIRSTAGSVTVAEPIYDTTGRTTISAAGDVHVDRLVENVRTLAALSIGAGGDINVNAQIGQDRDALTDTGPIALLAGRDVNVGQDVVSRNAPLTVQGTAGTVRVAPGRQLRSGNATLSVAAGGDLFVGDPLAPKPNADTPYVTTGTLNVSSVAGTLFIEAPIPDSTGPVNLSGGNAVRVNERIYSNDRDIAITAGPGGIVMNGAGIAVPDPQSPTGTSSVAMSDTDARRGSLTLQAQGDISAPSVRTSGILTIESTGGRILGGRVIASRAAGGSLPSQVRISATQGIDSFDTNSSRDVEARSSAGSVNLGVFSPQRLFVQAALDVRTGGFLGSRVELVAGRDVILAGISDADLVRVSAGRDFLLNGAVYAGALKADAGRDVRFATDPDPMTLTWIEGPGGNMTLKNPATPGAVESIRGLGLSAGNDIVITRPVHVSDNLSTGTEAALQPTALNAGRNVFLGQLETIGPVSIGAATGNITIGHPLGAPVPVLPAARDLWNPDNLGVASLTLSAPGAGALIDMQGARSQGDIAIGAPSGAVVSAFALTASPSGSVSVTAPSQALSSTPISQVERLVKAPPVAPPVAPGPLRAAPPGPQIPAAPPPAAPALPEILVTAPEAIDAGTLALPGAAGDDATDRAAELAAEAARSVVAAQEESAPDSTDQVAAQPAAEILVFGGGRGLARSIDLGRSGAFGSAPDLPTEATDDERQRRSTARPR